MALQVDLDYPRQVQDVTALKAALKTFDKSMNTMMVLMKDLGTALEGVSRAFDALTSMHFSSAVVKTSVHAFSVEVLRVKEGAPFQDYNTRVHDDVMAPVQELKALLAQTERAAGLRDVHYKQYLDAKKRVDAKEKLCARHSRPLETSRSYPALRQQREDRLCDFQAHDQTFQSTFHGLVGQTDTVVSHALRRYLELNAAYLAAVIAALVRNDDSTVQTDAKGHSCPTSSFASIESTWAAAVAS